jgi:sterol desaturase/sphingolipid hydroxylase (fatty acid hydroxylase superfamily)
MSDPQVHAYLANALRACAWLLIVTLIFAPFERFAPAKSRAAGPSTLASDLGFFFVSSFLPQLVLALPLAAAGFIAYRLVPASLHSAVAAWPLWLRGVSAFIVADLGFYWGHRWAHASPLLWRFHAVHHAPEHVYYLISARAHPVDNAFIRLCGLVPIYILGLGAPQSVQGTLVATLLMLAVTVWGFFIHANIRLRLGPLEWLVATPAFHLWHHNLGEPRDRNFASMLPIWDMLFGTHHLPRRAWPSAYGVAEQLPTSLAAQLIHPFLPSMPVSSSAPTAAPVGELRAERRLP